MKLTTNYTIEGVVAVFEYEGTPEEVEKMWRVVEDDKERIVPIVRDAGSGAAYTTVSCNGDYDLEKRVKKIILEEMRVGNMLHK